MEKSKIAVSIGEVQFSGEGDQEWLSAELEKTLATASKVLANQPKKSGEKVGAAGVGGEVPALATFLKDHNADVNQTRKFLATAIWLTKKGTAKPSTSGVSQALKNAHQSRLGNAAECLNANVKKGFCEKEGKEFFVTTEGLRQLLEPAE